MVISPFALQVLKLISGQIVSTYAVFSISFYLVFITELKQTRPVDDSEKVM